MIAFIIIVTGIIALTLAFTAGRKKILRYIIGTIMVIKVPQMNYLNDIE